MNWFVSLVFGALAGIMVILLLAQAGVTTLTAPEIRWTLDTTKYLISAMVATVLFLAVFVYYG